MFFMNYIMSLTCGPLICISPFKLGPNDFPLSTSTTRQIVFGNGTPHEPMTGLVKLGTMR